MNRWTIRKGSTFNELVSFPEIAVVMSCPNVLVGMIAATRKWHNVVKVRIVHLCQAQMANTFVSFVHNLKRDRIGLDRSFAKRILPSRLLLRLLWISVSPTSSGINALLPNLRFKSAETISFFVLFAGFALNSFGVFRIISAALHLTLSEMIGVSAIVARDTCQLFFTMLLVVGASVLLLALLTPRNSAFLAVPMKVGFRLCRPALATQFGLHLPIIHENQP
jgi:hypothetical protein